MAPCDRRTPVATVTFLRGRPWLVPCLLVIFIGVTQLFAAADASHPTFRVVAGLMVIAGGGVILFSAEYATRKRRNVTPGSADSNTDPRIPPAAR